MKFTKKITKYALFKNNGIFVPCSLSAKSLISNFMIVRCVFKKDDFQYFCRRCLIWGHKCSTSDVLGQMVRLCQENVASTVASRISDLRNAKF
jgi:hypothetical protein